MGVLNFSKANCRNCYKCLRFCPVKAIKIKNEQAEIVEDKCIACGKCLVTCPQNARNIKSDLQRVKEVIKEGRKVVVSIAPSFAGAFTMKDERQIVNALKLLGATNVEETALGAELVAKLYRKQIKEFEYSNIITTCCPSVILLIEKYFPELIKYMLPIVSPMIAHGKVLKHMYGMDSFVVFIGPCIAKKVEAMDFQHKGAIDAVLTFDELSTWLEDENIVINDLNTEPFDRKASINGVKFPVSGGVISSFLDSEDKLKYDTFKVNGIDECIELFNCLRAGNLEGVCIEANICKGGCIGGPLMPKDNRNFYSCLSKIKNYIKTNEYVGMNNNFKEIKSINFSKRFFDQRIDTTVALNEEISKILKKMGKFEEDDELNCGACGYNTCKEKAQAVLEGMAEMNMCLPFMRSKAESLKNVIFENSPNVIMMIDEDMMVKEFNPTAERVFGIKSEDIKDKPISILMEDSLFEEVIRSKTKILKQKSTYNAYNVVLMQNILYLEKQNIILAIMVDITSEESNKKELTRVKENTFDAAQRVIEKQMRVAQEIASLLGETTGETKIILSKLKEIAKGEDGDIK